MPARPPRRDDTDPASSRPRSPLADDASEVGAGPPQPASAAAASAVATAASREEKESFVMTSRPLLSWSVESAGVVLSNGVALAPEVHRGDAGQVVGVPV